MEYEHKYSNNCDEKYDCTAYQLFGVCYNCKEGGDEE